MKRRNQTDMNIGFIGLGNMAQAMLGGIIKKELVEPCDIYAWDISEASRKNVGEKLGINILDSNEEVAEKADFLFLAVKPGVVEGVIKEIREHVRPETVVVSIAAGKSLSFLLNAFSKPEVKVIRCMPNTPALVGMGCTAVTPSETVEVGELEKTLTILRSFGKAEVVAEYLMDAVVGVSGSS
ncbi:MAG: NAD(P)-binding domain-containing protein, partial [Lachnospiraceae bacterium]|nr:NAD(P)-binding domain-containing protein [Lachnospiraceae bacterium]